MMFVILSTYYSTSASHSNDRGCVLGAEVLRFILQVQGMILQIPG